MPIFGMPSYIIPPADSVSPYSTISDPGVFANMRGILPCATYYAISSAAGKQLILRASVFIAAAPIDPECLDILFPLRHISDIEHFAA